jgi:molybdopterin-binding protein
VAATVRTADGDLAISRAEDPADLFVTVDPRDITLHTQPPEGSAQNVFAGPILELAPEPPGGARVRVVLGTRPPLVAEVTRDAVESLGLAEGITVHASFKATGIRAYR